MTEYTVEMLKSPTDADWRWVKTCTLNTVGKTSTKLPTESGKRNLLKQNIAP